MDAPPVGWHILRFLDGGVLDHLAGFWALMDAPPVGWYILRFLDGGGLCEF